MWVSKQILKHKEVNVFMIEDRIKWIYSGWNLSGVAASGTFDELNFTYVIVVDHLKTARIKYLELCNEILKGKTTGRVATYL